MPDYSNRTVSLYAKGGASFPVCSTVDPPDNISKNFSGVVLEQTQNDFDATAISGNYIEQSFYLPNDYTRVNQTPALTGFQIPMLTQEGAKIKYRIYRYDESLAPRSITDTKIINVSGNGTYVTYTTSVPHYLDPGDIVTIEGFNIAGLNGTFSISSSTSTTFKIQNSTATSGVVKYGRTSTPPRRSYTLENGITYVRSAVIPIKDIDATYLKLIKFNKKTKRIHFIVRYVINKKIKIPKNAIIIDRTFGKKSSLAPETPEFLEILFNNNSLPREEFIKLNIKKEKKKNSKIVNYKTVLYANNDYFTTVQSGISFSGGKHYPTNFETMIKAYGGKFFNKWMLTKSGDGQLEIWTPHKNKKEVVTTKWTNKDITGEASYREYLDVDDRYDSPVGWVGVGEGEITASSTGWQIMDAKFAPLEIADSWVGQKFKLVLEFSNIGSYWILLFGQNAAFPSVQSSSYALQNQFIHDGLSIDDFSLAFRLLGATANEGTDFLSNKFRSVVVKNNVNNVNDSSDEFWSSKPNPSKYGIENLYFDVSSASKKPVVIDSVFLDPLTPGVNFNVYYSSDDNGPTDVADMNSWDNLLWTRVPKVFKAHKKQSYALPEPITAKYIKIEFSSLQATYYNPGVYAKPILYKKYPSWVVNYFLSIHNMEYNKTEDTIVTDQTRVTYDLLNMAFNYYKGDIMNTVTDSVVIDNNQNKEIVNLLKNAAIDLKDYDQISLNNIKAAFDKFRRHPGYHTDANTVVGSAATLKSIDEYFNYITESLSIPRAKTDSVSTTDRNHLLLEKSMPDMYFYPVCRHSYKEAYAKFENNKAYFVKIREVRFERNNHRVINDNNLYKFAPGDFHNFENCDLTISKDKWSVS